MSAGKFFIGKNGHFCPRYARDDLANQEGEDPETSASYLTLKILLDNKADDKKVDNFGY